MKEIVFIKDYKSIDIYRKSFNELAIETFGISFENWYQNGFWNQRYLPFSFIEGEKVIANVSVNLLDLIIHGETKSAVQIGTVMTHPEYRKRGLSTALMNKVIEEYENQCDFMYLFANPTVMNFYPRFGFHEIEEHLFSTEISPGHSERVKLRKLNVNQENDLAYIYQFALERMPASRRFGTSNAEGIFMYYCLNVFNDDIYLLEDDEVIVIFQEENYCMDIFDILFKSEISMRDIVAKLIGADTIRINFHFTLDDQEIMTVSNIHRSRLFVRTNDNIQYPIHVKHPTTSIA